VVEPVVEPVVEAVVRQADTREPLPTDD